MIVNLKRWHRAVSPTSPPAKAGSLAVNYLHESLLLCTQVIDLAFSQLSENQAKVDGWTPLCSQLQIVQNSQPREVLHSLLTSPIGSISFSKPVPSTTSLPSSFPLHIHTNRLSFYVAFVNHLTCLLLIRSKPRKVDGKAGKGLRTETWHAVQLCGLSLSNTILWNWDPVIVAALLYAGPLLSYAGQQKELLLHLVVLRKTTGWLIEEEIHRLEEFWKVSS